MISNYFKIMPNLFFNVEKTYLPGLKEPRESLANIDKVKKILDWEPTMDVEEWIMHNLDS